MQIKLTKIDYIRTLFLFIQDSVVCLVYTCLTEPHQWCNCKCAGFECGVDRGSEKTLESVFVASLLSTQH